MHSRAGLPQYSGGRAIAGGWRQGSRRAEENRVLIRGWEYLENQLRGPVFKIEQAVGL